MVVHSSLRGFNPLIIASSIQRVEFFIVSDEKKELFQSANNRVFNSEKRPQGIALPHASLKVSIR